MKKTFLFPLAMFCIAAILSGCSGIGGHGITTAPEGKQEEDTIRFAIIQPRYNSTSVVVRADKRETIEKYREGVSKGGYSSEKELIEKLQGCHGGKKGSVLIYHLKTKKAECQ